MIERVIVEGYRRFGRLDISPVAGMNLIVGDNESGKSTLLEAIGLVLTGRVNGRAIGEELNPYWFHQPNTLAFFAGDQTRPPEILIEVYLKDDDAVQPLRGVHNSIRADCPGVRVHIAPSADYAAEFAEYVASGPPPVVPVEYYDVEAYYNEVHDKFWGFGGPSQ